MNSDTPQNFDEKYIVSCFQHLQSPQSTPEIRKQADQQLIELESQPISLIHALLNLHSSTQDLLLSFQALVYLANVVKRTWTQRRKGQEHSSFEAAKRLVRDQLLVLAVNGYKTTLATTFDLLKFIVKIDYPHHYPAFTQFAVQILTEGQQHLNDPPELLVAMLKQLREIYLQLSQRKSNFTRKQFDEHLRPALHAAGTISVNIKDILQKDPSVLQVKTSKYCDQILYYLLKAAPPDILDDPQVPNVLVFLQQKTENLLSLHKEADKKDKVLLQKNIKSLIYDTGLLQLSKPLSLGWTLPRFYQILFYVLTNYSLFQQPAPLKYAIIGLRRILKEFSYYAEDNIFNSSIKGKQLPACTMELRNQCHKFYQEQFTPQIISNLLSFLLTNPFPRSTTPDPDPGALLEKGQEKELTLEGSITWLLQAVLQRFSAQCIELLYGLLNRALQNNDLPEPTLINLLSAVALLPSSCKRQPTIGKMPILQTLKFILDSGSTLLQNKFPPIVAGWLQAFQGNQLPSLTQVLLGFMEQAAGRSEEQIQLLLGCCQCLDKMVTNRPQELDLPSIVRGSVPLVLGLLGKLQNPQVLWPMVSLVAKLLSRSQLDETILLGALEGGQLNQLVLNNSPLLVEALCEMLRGFLCVLPRQRPARAVHELVCAFLEVHLGKVQDLNYEKIFQLWYVAIRQYSPIHGCENLLRDLFQTHFRKNLFRKTPTLLYTLQQYLLAQLLPPEITAIVQIILDSYSQASAMEGEEGEKVKIAALSLMITLISTRPLPEVNSDQMLKLILGDMFSQQGISPTIRNSLLSIINRYLLNFREPFLSYLSSLQVPLHSFLEVYFNSMNSLTSHSATKICILSVLSFLNAFEPKYILPHMQTLLSVIVPELELPQNLSPAVVNSPTLRFASNVLSQRKEELRRQDGTEGVDLRALFGSEMKTFLGRSGLGLAQLQSLVGQDQAARVLRLL